MLQAKAAYNPTTRTLTLSQESGGLLAFRRIARVDGTTHTALTELSVDPQVRYTFSEDGVYQLVLQQVEADGTVLDESAIFTHLEDGTQQRAFADLYLRHAQRPYVRGNDVAYRAAHLRVYSFRATAAERNPSIFRALAKAERHFAPLVENLPYLVPQSLTAPGLPVPFSGVQWRVDQPVKGSVTVTTRLTAATNLNALAYPPDPTQPGEVVMPLASGDLLTFQFKAPSDGIYRVALRFGSVTVTTLLIPVLRKPFLALREQVREESLALKDRARRSPENHVPRLARLAAAEAAARTGKRELADNLIASAGKLPEAEKPTHTFPLR